MDLEATIVLLKKILLQTKKISKKIINFYKKLIGPNFTALTHYDKIVKKTYLVINMKYLSCKDIESSLYIAPNEIRSCCQRFFHKNKMRGDTKLLEIKDGITPKANEIKKAREDLFEKIQKNKAESCEGCPFLYKTNTKPKFSNEIKHLSIEHHSVCNLRCTYKETHYDKDQK